MIKALCVCNGAHVRSVTLARLLNKRGLETLTCGVDKDFSDATIRMLWEWADVVYIQKDSMGKLFKRFPAGPLPGNNKLDTRFDVGPDDWKVPQHPDLLRIMREQVTAAEREGAFAGACWLCQTCGTRQLNPK